MTRRSTRLVRASLISAVAATLMSVGIPTASAGALTVGPTQVYGVGGIHHDGAVYGVSCPADGCVAVGSNESTQKPLVVTDVPSAPVASYADSDGGRHSLYDVWCGTPTSCVAVGYADLTTGNHQYITGLSGGVWTRVADVDPPDFNPSGGFGIRLFDVSCADEEHCVAVGSYQTNGSGTPANGVRGIAYSKVGSTWSVQVLEPTGSVVDSVTNPPTTGLTSVRCISTTTCLAVGTYAIGAGTSVVPYLATGTVTGSTITWVTQDIPIPDFQSSFSALDSIYFIFGPAPLLDCGSPSDCAVVGTYVSTVGSSVRNYVWSLTGGAWDPAAATYATDPSDPNVPRALACPTATRCYAVGNTASGAHGTVLTLDHGSPSLTILDKPGNVANWLVSVACPNRDNCAVAGYGNVDAGVPHVTVGARQSGLWAMSPTFAEVPSEYVSWVSDANALACEPDGTCVVGGTSEDAEDRATLTTLTLALTLDPEPDDDGGSSGGSGEPTFTG